MLAHGHNNGAGYRALCRLISDAHARTTGKARGTVPVAVTRAELASRTLHPDTLKPVLTVLIGPDSDVGRAMGGRRYLRPRTLFKRWLDAMPPGTLAAEIVSQLSPPGEPLSTAHAVRMLKLAAEHGVPAVLTNAVRYVAEDGAATADVLDSARTLKSLPELSAAPLLQPNGQGWLKSAAQMLQLGKEIIHAAGYGSSGPQTAAGPDRGARGPLPHGSGSRHGLETARGPGGLRDRDRRRRARRTDPAL